tara:strand:+ start:4243 stop:4659 length:417 start_codon:yes stop_codon:yes gene_type:complete
MFYKQTELFKEFYSIPKGVDTKKCIKCHKDLPVTSFAPEAGYFRTECRKCKRELQRLVEKLKKENEPPPLDYQCPICGSSREDAKEHSLTRTTPWVLDHCHTTHKVRGWICQRCNRGLGVFKDSVDNLRNAISYLANT